MINALLFWAALISCGTIPFKLYNYLNIFKITLISTLLIISRKRYMDGVIFYPLVPNSLNSEWLIIVSITRIAVKTMFVMMHLAFTIYFLTV
jgi:hypothetical protein